MITSVYIHIPFCVGKCIYCDFFSVPSRSDDETIRLYAHALVREIGIRTPVLQPLATLYVGGGTPTLMPPDLIVQLMDGVRQHAGFGTGCEATIEANPGTVSGDAFVRLRKSGFNRLSLGVQSFSDRELSALGRIHSSDEARAAFSLARDAGFDNISIDLIYGIPGQSRRQWSETLDQALALRPEHISMYELTPEPGTPLKRSLDDGAFALPHENEVVSMYDSAIDLLAGAGFEQYEISNFARPGYTCRHNMIYWDRVPYVGIGAGAHSFCGSRRLSNVCDVKDYVRLIGMGVLPVAEETPVSAADAIKETIFLGIRKREGFDLETLPSAIAEAISKAVRLPPLDGLVDVSGTLLRLTRPGLPLCNEAIVAILLCIEPLLPA